MSTIAEISQLNIDKAFLQARVQTLIHEQSRDYVFAFDIYDAPSDKARQISYDRYWSNEEKIQECLSKIHKINVELK